MYVDDRANGGNSGGIAGSGGIATTSSGFGGAGGSAGTGGCTSDCSLCGGTCQGSKCVPQVLATEHTSASFAGNLLLDADYVYWGIQAIQRVPKAGGPVEVLANDSAGFAIAKDESFLYWVQWWQGAVMKVPLDGSSPPVMLAQGKPYGKDEARGIAIDASTVYWTTHTSEEVWSVSKTGGMPTLLTQASRPSSIVVDASRMYFVETAPKASIISMSLGGGVKTTLAVGPWASNTGAGQIALSADSVFWANDTGDKVLRVPLKGGQPTTVASNQAQPWYITLDSTHAYWTNTGIDVGSVMTAPISGGPAVELAGSPEWNPSGLAVDKHCVYWASHIDNQTGAILRVAK